MQDKDRDLSVYRLSLAKETLANAGMCLDNRFYRDCINRSYYAVFYSIKAILAIEGIDFKRHKDAVREVGKRLGRIKMMREESDYSDFLLFLKRMRENSIKRRNI